MLASRRWNADGRAASRLETRAMSAERPPKLDAAKRARLRDIVSARSLLRGEAIKLASGASSTYYFDMKRTAFDPEAANLIAELALQALADEPVDYVGGLELGAVPLVACLSQKSFPARPIRSFFVRKQAKDHGTRRTIEGLLPTDSLAGKRCVMIDDVTTSAGSVVKAVEAARAEGAVCDLVVTVVDRREGAAQNLAKLGIRLLALLDTRDFTI